MAEDFKPPIDRVSKKEKQIFLKMKDDDRYDDDVIIEEMVKSGAVSGDFVQKQKAKGRTSSEIAHYLFTGRTRYRPTLPNLGSMATAAGAANTLGGPADMVSLAGNAAISGAEKAFPQLGELGRIDPGPLGSQGIKQNLNEWRPGTTYETLEDLQPGDRPAARAIEGVTTTIGMGAGLVGFAKGARKIGLTKQGSWLDNIGKYSKRFFSEEVAAGFGSGSAGGLAQYADAHPGWVTAWELAGAVVAPWSIVGAGSKKLWNSTSDIVASYSGKGGVEGLVARRLQKAIKDAGEDPEKIADKIKEIRNDLSPEGKLVSGISPGLATGDDFLLGMERELSFLSKKYGDDRIKKASAAIDALGQLSETLYRTGNPGFIQEAGKLRKAAYEGYFAIKFGDAQQEIAETMAKFGARGDSIAASRSVKKTLMFVLDSARKKEDQLWKDVGHNVLSKADGTAAGINTYIEKTADLAIRLPDVEKFKEFHRTALAAGTGISASRLQALRSTLLQRARNKDLTPTERKLHYEMAGAIWSDLEKVEGTAAAKAREFTTALNSTFGKTFAGEATDTFGDGRPFMEPEEVLSRMFRNKDPQNISRMRELRDAAGFGKFNVDGQIETFLGDKIKTEIYVDGKINQTKLHNFVKDPGNKEVFEAFPGLKAALSDAESAANHFAALEKIKRATDRQTKMATFAKAAGANDITKLVDDSLKPSVAANMRYVGPEQTLPYGRLVRLAKTRGAEAIDGLRFASIDAMMRRASVGKDGISWVKLQREMLKEIPESKDGFLRLMQRHGVISDAGVKRWTRLINYGANIEKSLSDGGRILSDDATLSKIEPTLGLDFVIRAGGANIATNYMPMVNTIGGSLVVAQEGSRVAQELFKNIPGTRIKEVLVKAGEDSEFLETLLTKGVPSKKYQDKVSKAYLALIQAGISAPADIAFGGESPEPESYSSADPPLPYEPTPQRGPSDRFGPLPIMP